MPGVLLLSSFGVRARIKPLWRAGHDEARRSPGQRTKARCEQVAGCATCPSAPPLHWCRGNLAGGRWWAERPERGIGVHENLLPGGRATRPEGAPIVSCNLGEARPRTKSVTLRPLEGGGACLARAKTTPGGAFPRARTCSGEECDVTAPSAHLPGARPARGWPGPARASGRY